MGTETSLIHCSFLLAAVFYTFGLFLSVVRLYRLAGIFLACGLTVNLFSIGLRYWVTFPMLPLYQGPFFLPFFIGLLSFKVVWNDHHKSSIFLLLICGMAWAALFFPNDYYLPSIQFKTLLSHLFFLFGIIGKSFFLIAGCQAIHYIWVNITESSPANMSKDMGHNIIWGFLFWTLSIFSGAIWSYLGWGSPVVWDDPVITTAMATWLYYGLFLHLHLMTFGTKNNRLVFALAGAVWVLLFNCLPDMGKFMLPRF